MTDELTTMLQAMLASFESGCEVVEEGWGTFVVNPEFHRIHEANFLWLRELPPGGLPRALERADEVFAPYGVRDRFLVVEPAALRERLRPELTARGFTGQASHVMVARRVPVLAANRDVTVRPARDQATRDDHDAIAGLIHEEAGYDHDLSHQMLALHWRRIAALGSEVYVSYLEGQAAGNIGWVDIDGVGFIFEVETVPPMRRRGVAATMVLAMRARAEATGLRTLGLDTPVRDTTWQMYERLGFERVGTIEEFLAK